jgi:hypothetical protein
MRDTLFVIGALLGLAACSGPTNQGGDIMIDDRLRTDISFLAVKRIFFGHQSVGFDIVNGVKDLAAMAEVPGMRIVEADDSARGDGPFFAHSFVGENGAPDAKCDDFVSTVSDVLGDSLDLAMMKFCYADIRSDRDVEAMFEHYQSTMERLIAEHPSVTFVHITVPVTMRSAWWKRLARSVLGKEDPWDISSTKQYEFNQMMRAAFGGRPMFDLAQIGSTSPDGARAEFEYRGKPANELIAAYTYDGGHLNEYGRKVVARAFIHTLADILRSRQ